MLPVDSPTVLGAYHVLRYGSSEAETIFSIIHAYDLQAADDPRVLTLSCGLMEDEGKAIVIVSGTDEGALSLPKSLDSVSEERFEIIPLGDPIKGSLAVPQQSGGSPSLQINVAKLGLKPGRRDEAIRLIEAEFGKTHAEEGAHRFSLHPSSTHPDTLIAVEAWRAPGDWVAHMNAPYCRKVMVGLNGLLEGDMQVYIATRSVRWIGIKSI